MTNTEQVPASHVWLSERRKRNLSFPDAEQLSNNRPTNCRHLCQSSLNNQPKKRKTPIWDLSWNFQKLHHVKPLVLSKGWLYEKNNSKGTVPMLAPSFPSNQQKTAWMSQEGSKSLVSGLWPQYTPFINRLLYHPFTNHWSIHFLTHPSGALASTFGRPKENLDLKKPVGNHERIHPRNLTWNLKIDKSLEKEGPFGNHYFPVLYVLCSISGVYPFMVSSIGVMESMSRFL